MSWNPDEEEASTGSMVLPKGAYRCLVVEAKQNFKNVNSVGVQVVLQVIEHEPQAGNKYDGRKVFLYFTWDNLNEMAKKIGRRQLADLLFAAGKNGRPYNSATEISEALQDTEVIANLKIVKRSDTGEDKNEAAMFFNLKGQHRGDKQTVKMFPWGGIEEGLGSGRGNGQTSAATSEDGDVPF